MEEKTNKKFIIRKNKDNFNIKDNQYPYLNYCEDNVLHIYNDYRIMVTFGKDKDKSLTVAKLKYDYEFLEHKKKQLAPSAVKKKGWGVIREDTFNSLVKLLHDKGWLTLYDNRLTYQNGPAVFYSLRHLYKANSFSQDFKQFAGEYRSFSLALVNNDNIIKGNLVIDYHEDGNFLTTKHNVTHHKDHKKEYVYTGTIIPLENTEYLLLKGSNNDVIEETFLNIVRFDDKGVVLEGISSVYSLLQKIYVVRRVFIDSFLDKEPFPDKKVTFFSLESKNLPQEYREFINKDNHNFSKFYMKKTSLDINNN